MRKLVRWSRMQNLIGGAGGSLREPCHKLTPVNNGLSRSRPMRLSTQDTTANRKTLTERERAWSLPMHWAVKIETCPTSVCGPTTPQNWPSNTDFQHRKQRRSWNRSWKVRHGSTKTRCRVNWPTWCPEGWPTCLTCKGPTTPWMQHAPRPWPPSWMRAVCSKHGRWMPCSPGRATAPWTLPRSPNSRPSVRCLLRILRHSMPVPTDS